jgi:uncharacterized protein YrzB (UPF0473 family)
MRRFEILFVLFCLFAINGLIAAGIELEKIIPLQKKIVPSQLRIYDNKAYIALQGDEQDNHIIIISLEDGSLLRAFGRKGTGPEEFKLDNFINAPIISISEEGNIIANSLNRLSIYDSEGNFIKQSALRSMLLVLIPFGNNFIGTQTLIDKKNKSTYMLSLYNKDFERQKDLLAFDKLSGGNDRKSVGGFKTKKELAFPPNSFAYEIHNSKLYVFREKDDKLVFNVYDYDGNEVMPEVVITFLDKTSIDSQFIKDTITYMSKITGKPRDMIRTILTFKSKYTIFKNVIMGKDKFYVITHEKAGNHTQYVVMDTEGNPLTIGYLPLPEQNLISTPLYDIKNGKLYIIYENEKDEEDEDFKLYIYKMPETPPIKKMQSSNKYLKQVLETQKNTLPQL